MRTMAVLALGLSVGCAAGQVSVRPPEKPVPHLPVVLVHGIAGAGHGLFGEYFVGVEDALTARGVTVIAPNLSPYASSTVRAAQLRAAIEQLLAQTGHPAVHIIGHSQGGLDARYLLATPGGADLVATLTTVSTPHRGSAVADFFHVLPDPLLDVSLWVSGRASAPFSDLPLDGSAAVKQLTSDEMAAFNAAHPTTGVPTFSVAGVTNHRASTACDDGERFAPPPRSGTTPWLWPTHVAMSSLSPQDRDNDGLVSVRSSRFGRFLGCVPADHVAMVGVASLPVGGDAAAVEPVDFFVDHLAVLAEAEADLGLTL